MSSLTIFSDALPETAILQTTERTSIQAELAKVGIRFEQWPIHDTLGEKPSCEQIQKAYDLEIKQLLATEGYQSWDIITLNPDNPNKQELRKKFLAEHTHREDEVRYFVSGQGLFTLHIFDLVYCVLCEKGDFISVPAETLHWFDMGSHPHFIALRFFNNPDGWIATYSGNGIADKFPRLL
jgi:1,2-dihydroxy-3-keto-5-methylthiopentene dioxygenase